jgi:chaperonin GroEL
VDGEALATLVLNKLRGVLQLPGGEGPRLRRPAQGHAPGHRHPHRRQVITEELGRKLDSVQIADLGRADKVVATKEETTIVGGKGLRGADQGPHQPDQGRDRDHHLDYDKEKLQERLAKLAGGVAIIRVGAGPRWS